MTQPDQTLHFDQWMNGWVDEWIIKWPSRTSGSDICSSLLLIESIYPITHQLFNTFNSVHLWSETVVTKTIVWQNHLVVSGPATVEWVWPPAGSDQHCETGPHWLPAWLPLLTSVQGWTPMVSGCGTANLEDKCHILHNVTISGTLTLLTFQITTLQSQSKFGHILSILSLSCISTLQFLTEGVKTIYEDTWNYVGNNKKVI